MGTVSGMNEQQARNAILGVFDPENNDPKSAGDFWDSMQDAAPTTVSSPTASTADNSSFWDSMQDAEPAKPPAAPNPSFLDSAVGFVPHQLGLLANAGVKGATGLATLGANIPAAAANAVSGAYNMATGGHAGKVPYVNPFGEGADAIFGPNGQPKNTAERLEQDIATPIAGVASGGASGLSLLAKNLPVQYGGAITGGLGGGLTREAGGSPTEQLVAGIGSSLLGTGLTSGAQSLYGSLTKAPADVAIGRLARDFGRDGNISPDQAQSILENSPEGTTMADIGGANVQSLGKSVVNTPGQGRQNAINTLVGRASGAAQRVQAMIKSAFGTDDEFNATLSDLQDGQKAAAAPLYQKAFQSAPVTNTRIQNMLATPELQTGIKRGLTIQRIESAADGVPFNPSDYAITGFNEAGDPIIGNVPNMRLLDAGKKGLDAMIGDETDSVTGKVSEMGRALVKLKQSYVKQLDGINPAYAAARQAFSGPAQSQNALQMGRNFLNEDAETTAEDVANLAPGDKKFFQIGAARALSDKAAANPNATVKNILTNDLTKQKLQAALPSKNAYYDFAQNAQNEANMSATKNAVLGNSSTVGQAVKNSEDNIPPAFGLNLGNFLDAANGDFKGAVVQFAKNAYDRMRTPPNVGNELGRMLFNTDPAMNQQTIQAWKSYLQGQQPTPFINRAAPYAAPLLYQGGSQ